MAGPEANQQYDLWVDRCRQQLARGAAGDALAAWMRAEGVSAEMAAAVVQTAIGETPADRVPSSDGAAAATQFAHAGPADRITPATAHNAPLREATAAFAGAQGDAAMLAGGGPLPASTVPSQPDTQPTVGTAPARAGPGPSTPPLPLQAAVPPEPAAATRDVTARSEILPERAPAAASEPPPVRPTTAVPQSNLFGTPRPPVTFSPVTPPSEPPSQAQIAQPGSSSEKSAAAPEAGGELPRDFDGRSGCAPDEPSTDAPSADVTGPDPGIGMDGAHRPEDEAPSDEAHFDETVRIEDPAPAALQVGAEGLEQSLVQDAAAPDAAGPAQRSDDIGPGALPADETLQFGELPEGATSRERADLQEDGRQSPPADLDVVIEAEPHDDSGRSAGPVDETALQPAVTSAVEAEQGPDAAATRPARKRRFGRRSSGAPPAADTAGTEHAATTAGDRDRRNAAPDMADITGTPESELSRVIRDAKREAGDDTDAPPHSAYLTTGDALTAAAKQLGISFRDDRGKGRLLELVEMDDDMARTAHDLGIRFRDDPGATARPDPEDPAAKAARQLGISFRDLDRPKSTQQSTLKRYWPIILVMALAAIAMPVAALLMMYYWT